MNKGTLLCPICGEENPVNLNDQCCRECGFQFGGITEWDKLKKDGSDHYKSGVEPIDLYRSGGLLKHFALANIIKYAFRNRNRPIVEKDLDKINHYVAMLRVICHEGE